MTHREIDQFYPLDTLDLDSEDDRAEYGACLWCSAPVDATGKCRCGQPTPGQIMLELEDGR